jgi:ArsR family transcriptional regulator
LRKHIRESKYILDEHIRQCEYEINLIVKTAFHLDRFFQALGDRTRLRLLNLMADQEICVCYLVEILRLPQPTISRHLAYLRGSGIVAARREGKWMHYRIVAPPHPGAAAILRQTLAALQDERPMQADRSRLAKACCSPSKIAALDGAPVPAQLEAISCEAC